MNRSSTIRSFAVCGLASLVLGLVAARGDDPKQTIDAKGLTFEAPASWKSKAPTTPTRRAELTVKPSEGDSYPAELVVFSFGRAAGTVEDNLKRWQSLFKDEDGNPPKIESKKVKGKNVEVTRAETSGHYHPAQFGRRKEPDRPGARLLGAIVTGDDATYYIRMVGPDKTMKKLRTDFDDMLKTIQIDK
jgi:hypothetical protein